jgi:hypothetical protein
LDWNSRDSHGGLGASGIHPGRLEAQIKANGEEMKACQEKMGPFKKLLNPVEKK